MASVAPPLQPSTVWSNCSRSDMERSFATYPITESCLYNEPINNLSLVIDANTGKNTTYLRISHGIIVCLGNHGNKTKALTTIPLVILMLLFVQFL